MDPPLSNNTHSKVMENDGADNLIVNMGKVMKDGIRGNSGEGNEFIPGIGFKFLHELK